MVIDLVMLMVPKPPGSRQLISPFVAVFAIAPAKVLHGAVRLQGLTSSPTPEIHVRVAWALAVDAESATATEKSTRSEALRTKVNFVIMISLNVNPICQCCPS